MSPARLSRGRLTAGTAPRSLRGAGAKVRKRRARPFRVDIAERLARGEHLVLYGPLGSGKSTFLRTLHARLRREGRPSAIADVTIRLGDMTQAFARAYPEVDIAGLTQRRTRARLAAAAELRAGVLLFDHVHHLNTAMMGFLHGLRGGLAGIILAVDADGPRAREALRTCYPALSLVAMPRSSARQLRTYLHAARPTAASDLTPAQERQILRAARGRPGWVRLCALLLQEDRYWHDTMLYVTVLCTDTEIALRLGRPPFLSSATQNLQSNSPLDRRTRGDAPV